MKNGEQAGIYHIYPIQIFLDNFEIKKLFSYFIRFKIFQIYPFIHTADESTFDNIFIFVKHEHKNQKEEFNCNF